MRLDAIPDVHGNLPALEAVLESIPSANRLACAGNMVGYNPWPEECVSEPAERDVPIASGSHDRAVMSRTGFRLSSMVAAGVNYACGAPSPVSMDWLSALPKSQTFADGRAKLVHGRPNHPDRYTYPDDFSPPLLDDEDLLALGYTHVQGYRIYDGGTVLNPGNVGWPCDGDPRAAYTVVDFGAMEVEAEYIDYDIDRVAERVCKAGLPERLASRLYKGK